MKNRLMSTFNRLFVLAAACSLAFSCDKVNKLSDQTSIDSFIVTAASSGVKVKSVEIIPSDNPDDNRIVITTDATNTDYPYSVLVEPTFSGAEKIFYIPTLSGSESQEWDFMSPLTFTYGQTYRFVLIAESGLVNTYTISLSDNATGGGDYLEELFQIPNSDFEQWINTNTNKVNLNPTSIEGNNYWCTANNYFVQGTLPANGPNGLCAKMTTKKVDFVYRTIAAGTTFTGNFSSNVNLDNPRQMTFFGSHFIKRPSSMTFRMSYKAGEQLQKVENGNFVNLSGKDRGQAWVQLLYYSGEGEMEYHKDPAANIQVVGSGELVINDTNGWVEATIDIAYTDQTTMPNYIAIVFTSSIRGDYFEGAPGSVLMIDDVRLNYE